MFALIQLFGWLIYAVVMAFVWCLRLLVSLVIMASGALSSAGRNRRGRRLR